MIPCFNPKLSAFQERNVALQPYCSEVHAVRRPAKNPTKALTFHLLTTYNTINEKSQALATQTFTRELNRERPPKPIISPMTGLVYTLKNKLGEGTYATVYRASLISPRSINGKSVNLPCAVKVSKISSDVRLAQMTRYAQIKEEWLLFHLNHNARCSLPIIHYIEGFDDKGCRLTIYPLMGKSLHETLHNPPFKSFSLQEIKEIARQLLNGLIHLVSRSIMHRDLKPENILFKQAGSSQIVIADFGTAEEIQNNENLHIQTSSHRAAEVAFGFAYNEKIDIWSLGCTLIEMMTKHRLFLLSAKTLDAENQKLLIEMTKKLGSFPQPFLQQSPLTRLYPDFYITMTALPPTQNRLGEILFQGRELNTLNLQERHYLDLVQRMLLFDFHERISAQEASQHPFFIDEASDDPHAGSASAPSAHPQMQPPTSYEGLNDVVEDEKKTFEINPQVNKGHLVRKQAPQFQTTTHKKIKHSSWSE